MVETAFISGGFLVGVLFVWFGAVKSLQKERSLLKEAFEAQQAEAQQSAQEAALGQERMLHAKAQLEESRIALQEAQESIAQLQGRREAQAAKIAELETLLASEREATQRRFSELQERKEQMTMEFKLLSDKLLEQNSEKFAKQSQENLGKMLTPIKEQFDAFKKQIDDVYIKEAKDRSMLQAEIKSIKEINLQMSSEARNLTRALKGESKKQGVWGEMILESVLEHSGLRLGEEYEREVSLEHAADNSRYRPDVIIHLPDRRDIIVDAKTSLVAYEQYVNAEEEQKAHFASQHLLSIKGHIKALSDKEYTNLKGVNTVDFIFMFVPIESALLMALEEEPSLFDHAFKRGIILVGPTTLMVSLRAVENSWKQQHQQKNAQEIAKRAGLLFDKFAGYIESVEKMGRQLGSLQKSYDEVYGRLHTGAGSLTSQFQKLEKLGAAASKKLPENLLDEA